MAVYLENGLTKGITMQARKEWSEEKWLQERQRDNECQVKSNVKYVGVKAIVGFQMRQATGLDGLKIWEYREEIS
jgi:hypothetical protein